MSFKPAVGSFLRRVQVGSDQEATLPRSEPVRSSQFFHTCAQMFRQLFEEGLELQKVRLREQRAYAREQRQQQQRRHQDQFASMENYYKDQVGSRPPAAPQTNRHHPGGTFTSRLLSNSFPS